MLSFSGTSVGEICLKSYILAQAAGDVLCSVREAQVWAVITSVQGCGRGALCC